MPRVFFLFICFVFSLSVKSEKVISRERSFLAPAVVVRTEIKREAFFSPVSIPTPAPKVITLDTKLEALGTKQISLRPLDRIYIFSSLGKYSHNTYYSLNEGPFFSSFGPIQILKPGLYDLTYYSLDFFGNRETNRRIKVLIDGEPPNIEFKFSKPFSRQEDGNACEQGSLVSINGGDKHSGIKSIFWKTENESPWKQYVMPIPVSFEAEESPFMLMAYAIDQVGNVSRMETVSCYLKKIEDLKSSEDGKNTK